VLEDIHEVVLGACVIFGQSYLREVLLLLQKVVVESHIPTQWLSQLEQKVLVLADKQEAGSIWVKVGPNLLEMLANVCAHEFVLPLCRLLEGLQDNSNKQLHEDCANQKRVGEKEELSRYTRPTAHWLIIIPSIILKSWVLDALEVCRIFSRECFHQLGPAFASHNADKSDESSTH
jgi:hypothetical protein